MWSDPGKYRIRGKVNIGGYMTVEWVEEWFWSGFLYPDYFQPDTGENFSSRSIFLQKIDPLTANRKSISDRSGIIF